MEGITDNPFRARCVSQGADATFTEMARFEALARNNKSTLKKIVIKNETPTYIQIFGLKENALESFLTKFEPEKGFLGFNLNLGCPSPKVINAGLGCAMIKRIAKVQKLIKCIKDKGYPVSIKMRLGLNQREKEKKAYLNLINQVDADFFIVHARHAGQTYNDPPDTSIYQECVDTGKVIIANGSISTAKQVTELKNIGVKGVMIGRAAIPNPSIFNILKNNKI